MSRTLLELIKRTYPESQKPVGYKSPMQVMIDELQIKPINQNDINILPSYLRTDQELETKLNRVLYELGKLNQDSFNINHII